MRYLFPLLALLPLVSCASNNHGNLEGTWSLTHINHEPINLLRTQAAPTLSFAQGTLTDTTAEPGINATYSRGDDGRAHSIAMPDLATLNIPTMPDNLEAEYRIALQRADTARVMDGRLYLWDDGQEVLRFGHVASH